MLIENKPISTRQLISRIGLALAFEAVGSLIINVFSQYRPLLPAVYDLLGRLALMLALLVAALLLCKNKNLDAYWQLIFGLFIMTCAVSLDWWTARFVIDRLGGYPNTPAGVALEKLKTVIVVALSVIVLTWLSGNSLDMIYIQRGNLKKRPHNRNNCLCHRCGRFRPYV